MQEQEHVEQVAAILVAAGSSRRMLGRDKLWTPLAGRTTLVRTVEVFQRSSLIDSIIIVTSQERIADVNEACRYEDWHKVVNVVEGGARRQDSVRTGLDTLANTTPPMWVMIHDAARPFVTAAMLENGLRTAKLHQAAIAAVPVKDTIKQVQGGIIQATLDRSQLWMIQTPQVFAFPLIHAAHHTSIAQEDFTDDAALLERLGQPVTIFEGSYANIKITTLEDLLLAEMLLQGETFL